MEVINALGRRKAAVARVYVKSGKGNVIINDVDFKTYFPVPTLQYKINQAFALTGTEGKYDVTCNVHGGGINGQAEAVRLGISRALVKMDASMKPSLKKEGLTTRDPRMVERKKPGRKKARRRFQFSKR